MYNLGDDSELDRLSREAAGRYRSPGEPNWQAFSEELDKVLPVAEKKRRFVVFWWLLPVLLIGGGITYWQLAKNDQTIQATVAVKNQPGTISATDKKENVALAQPGVATDDNQKINTEKVSDNTAVTTDKQVAASGIDAIHATAIKPAKQAKDITAVNNRAITLNAEKKTTSLPAFDNVRPDKAASQKVDQPVTIVTTDKSSTTVTVDPATDKAADKKEPVKETPAEISNKQTADATTDPATKENKTEAQPGNVSPATEDKPQINKLPNTAKGKGWSFAVLAGIDKSTVKFTYGSNAGTNIGAMAGYHFNKNWSIHTGLIYTQKNYKLAGQDFEAPKGSPISYVKLETVSGYCHMWEVPLLARYTINPNNKNSFFLSTGLSSYFMTKEDYDYFYYYAGQPVTKNNSYDSKDTHILSILHLSAGVEKPLSKSWSMQVEPYAKLPLGGVGLGNIRLSSFGINLSVQHRQPAKK